MSRVFWDTSLFIYLIEGTGDRRAALGPDRPANAPPLYGLDGAPLQRRDGRFAAR